MTTLIFAIAACSVALGAYGTVWAQDYWRRRQAMGELKPILDWRPTLRMDARATAQAELSEDDNIPANWMLQAEEVRLVESISGYPHLEIRWRAATRREVRDFVSTYQRARAEEVKDRMNKLYASEVNVRYFDAAKSYRKRRRALRGPARQPKPIAGGHALVMTDKGATANHIETSAGEQPGEARTISPATH